ncbi:hypothetical protein L1987_58951 [Smallanthus sonchifolius]|uniref:Uncharacterized protein n=1 Tax=Smallanthus sonchifolius TaxID=185202 RepID=A0ACB9D457_9ASTR|nr:hypothetical protein L1987_58951 [Smallanthus sonchifolius]
MDPLFSRLHISDADKGGPRTPPRNKMRISQQLINVPSQSAQRCISGSVSPVLPLSTTNGSRLVPASSSCHDAGYKRSMFSSIGRSCGSTRMATRLDSYHSSGINLNISLTTVKQTIEKTNCQTVCNTGHPKPQDFRTTRNNTIVKNLEYEDDYLVPSFTIGNGQHNTNRGSFPTLSTNVYQKQLKLTDKDMTRENKQNTLMTNDIARESTPCYSSDRGRFSELSNEDVSPSIKRSLLIDEHQMLHDPNIRLPLKRKCFQENMSNKYGTKKIWTLLGEDRKIDRGTRKALAPINISAEDHRSLRDPGKIGDNLETDFLSRFNITVGKVSQIIGPEQYCIARRTIIRFDFIASDYPNDYLTPESVSLYPRNTTETTKGFPVTTLRIASINQAESPDLLTEDGFYKLKKSPSEDMYPHLDHQKENNDTEKIYNPTLIDLPPPPPPTVNGGKQPQWCFLPPPPPGNQWLVPIRSPSEGLIYKPLAGLSPPPVSLMPSVYGMSLTPSNADFLTGGYNIPTSYQQGIGLYPNTSLLTSYGFPAIGRQICSPAIDDSVNYSKNACNIESDLQGSSEDERKKGDALPLFPTTPMKSHHGGVGDSVEGVDVASHVDNASRGNGDDKEGENSNSIGRFPPLTTVHVLRMLRVGMESDS